MKKRNSETAPPPSAVNTEQIEYALQFESVLSNMEAHFRNSMDYRGVGINALKMVCEFYNGDWAGVILAELVLSIWRPHWWYKPEDIDRTDELVHEFESCEGLERWIQCIRDNEPLVVSDIEAIKDSYHEIRRASDRLCKEHGLSVIVPGRDKGKSYIEHQAAQNGTSYKAKLKTTIDRLISVSSSLEDLLVRLQREGYEIKRGKYISARVPDQKRFTRLKTLGVDYTEDAVATRIAGGPRPSRQPRQRSGKVSLLIDIQNNIKAQQSAGYQRWATIENLKRTAAPMNFLTEHGIGSYEELVERCDAVAAASIRTRESLRDTEQQITDLALLRKQIDTYRKMKPVYDRYKASKDKEKFLRGFESEIILFEAAAREIKKAGLTKLPSHDKLKAELDELSARKTALQAELRKVQREEKEYDTLRKNVVALLEKSKEQEWQQHRGNDLE